MGNRLTQIATRIGDAGTTGLGDNTRVSKNSLRVHAMGDVDELNSHIGVLLCEDMPERVRAVLVEIQHQLFNLGGELSIPGFELLKEEAVLALDQAALGGLWSEPQWQTELADPRRPGFGLWQGEQLQAMACGWLVVDELHITLVAVDPARRRQGLGRQVLGDLLQRARDEGARHATLEVAALNAAALALYSRMGFVQAGVRRAYYRNGDDALIQWLRLS